MARIGFILRCEDCKEENYISKKNKKEHPEKVTFKKYCFKCNKRVEHKEKRKK